MKFVGKVLIGILSFAAVAKPALSSTLRGHGTPKGQDQRSLLDSIEGLPQDAPPEYLVTLGNCEEAEFKELIQGLGGEVSFYHQDTSIAVVQDLSESAVSDAEASECVASIDMSENIPFTDPLNADMEALPLELNGTQVLSQENPEAAFFYPFQWNMRAIQADKAWEAGRLGSEAVTVAVLDTGIDYTYPDLNGRVDVARSKSFVFIDDIFVDYYFPGKDHITDLHYHGTHVAATVSSNGYVAAGVTSKTTLIGVKVCSAVFGYCPFSSIMAGLLHAVDSGADVANLSLGGSFLKNQAPGLTGYINKVFNYANSKKMTIVVAAGNSAINMDKDGASYNSYCDAQNTICVSATGPTSTDDFYTGPYYDIDAPAFYTNYGTSAVDVAAPGGNSAGSVWAACSQTSLVKRICQRGTYITGLRGTSMASPHVAGLAALLVEDVGRNPGRIKSIIGNSADDLGKNGVDPYYGKGRINVANAVL